MRPVSLSWLKPVASIDSKLIGSNAEEIGDFVNNRFRVPEKEPLWPENSELIFYTRGIEDASDSFFFYKFSLIRKTARKFLRIDMQMAGHDWSSWFSYFEKFLFVYVTGREFSKMLCYDMERQTSKQWQMPHLVADDGLCLFPTKGFSINYQHRCRISYRHELRHTKDEITGQSDSQWEIVSNFSLPCEANEMYEFDISSETRAYDPRDHIEDERDTDVIYVFNESKCAWEQHLCSEAQGVYGDIVKIYTPVLREIYREFMTVEIFHPGPDTKATEVFACYDREDLNPETNEFETIRDLYRARIRPVSLKTMALEKLLETTPVILDLDCAQLEKIGLSDQLISLLVEHREGFSIDYVTLTLLT